MKDITSSDFQVEVLDSTIPVIVDFWSPSCRPCLAMKPFLERVAEEMGDRVKFVRVDAGENLDLADTYGVNGLPTLLAFKSGKVAGQKIGLTPKDKIIAWVESL